MRPANKTARAKVTATTDGSMKVTNSAGLQQQRSSSIPKNLRVLSSPRTKCVYQELIQSVVQLRVGNSGPFSNLVAKAMERNNLRSV